MTITSHCVDLLKKRGPMTAEELGQACRAAGVTRAASPATSVSSALRYNGGQVVCIDDRWHLAADLLDGRWLTFERPVEPLAFLAGMDLGPVRGPGEHDGVPLVGGGMLRRTPHGYWSVEGRELPEGQLLGLRLRGDEAELTAVNLDDEAQVRGERLAARVLAAAPSRRYGIQDIERAEALLGLLAEDDGLLRAPVPPLSRLMPEPESSPQTWPREPPVMPGHRQLRVSVPEALHDRLDQAAGARGLTAGELVGDALMTWAAWPWRPDWSEDQYATYDDGRTDTSYDGDPADLRYGGGRHRASRGPRLGGTVLPLRPEPFPGA